MDIEASLYATQMSSIHKCFVVHGPFPIFAILVIDFRGGEFILFVVTVQKC